jgi:predicted AAA+ superfamily ATPase
MAGKIKNLPAYLQYLLQHFPAVAIIGPRQVGKTTLAKKIAPDCEYYI